jgi:hypothetical protein
MRVGRGREGNAWAGKGTRACKEEGADEMVGARFTAALSQQIFRSLPNLLALALPHLRAAKSTCG